MLSHDNSVKVSVIEVCKVAPAANPSSALSLPLTFLDARYLKFPPAERLYLFQLDHSNSKSFYSEICPKLKTTLSQTLIHFLPLAGHLIWPSHSSQPIIFYTPNDTVSLTIAESTADFDLLVTDEIREAYYSRPYVPELPTSETKASVIALQLTFFPNRGFSIGISMHHAALDGKSASMFMKAWAYASKSKNLRNEETIPALLPELTPSFDRTAIKDPDELTSFFLNQSDSESNPRSLKLLPKLTGVAADQVRATFQLSRERIEKLREMVVSNRKNEGSSEQQWRPSTYAVVSAYVSVCLVKARGGDTDTPVYLLVIADCRSRLDPPVSPNYFGNCVFAHHIFLNAGAFMQENGVADIAEKISGFVKGLEEGLFKGAKESHERLRSAGPSVQRVAFAGSPRFKYYEEDFGWGKPNKVEITSIDRIHAVSLMESRYENGGIEIGLVMPSKHSMESFADYLAQELH